MKKYLVFLASLTFGFVSLAQSTFKQATFKEMSDEYKKDSKAFFVNRLSEDFRYTNPQGKFLYKSDITKAGTEKIGNTTDAEKIVSTLKGIDRMLENILANEVLEPVIFQSCDLAIVSGRQKTTWIKNDGNEINGEVGCTYTFQKRKGKWMFVASQQTSLAD